MILKINTAVNYTYEGKSRKYNGKLKLLRGIELGQAMQNLAGADEALALDQFDFILASVHNVRNTQDFTGLIIQKISHKAAIYIF